MLDKRDVMLNLKMLERRFVEALSNPHNIREANFYAKLAVLEASGWLELCAEKIYTDVALSNLTVLSHINEYNTIVNDNHGFNYHKYIKNRLSRNLIGMIITEKIELKLNTKPKFINMIAAMNSLKTLRGDLAHSYLKGSTPTLQHVTLTINYFNQAYDGLKLLAREIDKVEFK